MFARSISAAKPMGQPLPLMSLSMRLTSQRSSPKANPTTGKKGRESLSFGASCPGIGKMVRVLKAVTSPRNMSDLSVVITESKVSTNRSEEIETRIGELAAGSTKEPVEKIWALLAASCPLEEFRLSASPPLIAPFRRITPSPRRYSLPLTPAESKVAISLYIFTAPSIRCMARAAPVPSPNLRSRSRMGRIPKRSKKVR